MEVTVFKPKNELLQQFIECFYTLKQSEPDRCTSYVTFPSIYSIVAILTNAEFEIDNQQIVTKESASTGFISSMVTHFKNPFVFTYTGIINEITIYFKPGGINAFLEKPVSFYNNADFNVFNPFDDYENNMVGVLKQPTDEEKITALENYLLSKYNGTSSKVLNEIVSTIIGSPLEEAHSINEMGKRYKTSRKTIHKLFIDHTGKSPTEFRKIVRFRKALENGMKPEVLRFITGIAHDANYYDQSHMLKDFKALTKQNPKSFFNALSRVHDNTIFWQLK